MITILNLANEPTGPFTRAQIAEKLQTGEVSLESLAFVEGLSQWTPLREVLARVDAAAAPLSVPAAPTPSYSYAATMQPPLHLVYAGFWIRVAAHLLDNLFVSVPFVLIWMMVVMMFVGASVFAPFIESQNAKPDPAVVASLVITVLFCYVSLIVGRLILTWLYHAMLESGPHQATWGKRIVGVKVTSVTGQRISFGHATGRYFSTFLTGMTMGIGYLMVAFTDKKQALHDMVANTLVVQNR